MFFNNLFETSALVILVIGVMALGFLWWGYTQVSLAHYLGGGSQPLRKTLLGTRDMAPQSDAVKSIHELLLAHHFRLLGAEQVKPMRHMPESTAYRYASETGETTAELVQAGEAFLLSLRSVFRDDSLLDTRFPMGDAMETPQLRMAYAAQEPLAALRHHQAALAEWTLEKGKPRVVRSLMEAADLDELIRERHFRSLYTRQRLVSRAIAALSSLGLLVCGLEVARLLHGGEIAPSSLLAMSTMVLFLIGSTLTGWLQRPPGPLDGPQQAATARAQPAQPAQPAPQTVSLWRLSGFIPLLAALAFPVLLVVDPGLLSGWAIELRRQEGDGWAVAPLPGDQVRGLAAAPDGAMWAMTAKDIVRWDGAAWQTIYSTDGHAIEFAVDGAALWAVNQRDIVRCDMLSRDCAVARAFPDGVSIAAGQGEVLALSAEATAALYQDGAWELFALAERLPGFNPSAAPDYLATTAITSDGTRWIEWGPIWSQVAGRGGWQAATYQQAEPPNADILAATGGYVWTEWSNGISRDEPALTNWDFYEWDIVGARLGNNIFDVAVDPNGGVWFGTGQNHGLIHFAGGEFEMIPVADASVVSELAFTPDNQLWIQVTRGGAVPWLMVGLALVVMLGIPRLIRWLAPSWQTSAAPRRKAS